MRKFTLGKRFNFQKRENRNKHVTPTIQEPPGKIEFLPKLPGGEEHPLPMYATEEITFAALIDPPYKEALEQEKREKFERFCRDRAVVRHFRDSFLEEALDQEILAVASLSITEVKYKKKLDRETELYMEEEIFLPTVEREVFICVWELLYDWGRDLPPEQFKDMQKREGKLQMDSDAKEILSAQMLEGLNWREDLTNEKKLSGEIWEVLLYNYSSKLQRNSFEKNVALHFLQERIISEMATEQAFDGLLSYLENDMTHLDEGEKTHTPPRAG